MKELGISKREAEWRSRLRTKEWCGMHQDGQSELFVEDVEDIVHFSLLGGKFDRLLL